MHTKWLVGIDDVAPLRVPTPRVAMRAAKAIALAAAIPRLVSHRVKRMAVGLHDVISSQRTPQTALAHNMNIL